MCDCYGHRDCPHGPDSRCPELKTWTGEMLGYPPLRCRLKDGHRGPHVFPGDETPPKKRFKTVTA